MKKLLGALCLAGIVFSVTACSSDYVISTNDGHMITTHGKPVKDKDTGFISYEDSAGNVHQVHQNDVKEIVEK